jgi:hypothetical protein
MGLNLLRWESKLSSEHVLDLADQEGIPVMLGWMCCNQWEKWSQWDAEDHRVARESLRARIRGLRPHPSVFLWANASDGLAPPDVLGDYHDILSELRWRNPVVDTVSSFGRGPDGKVVWDGIRMEGPYTWRPPTYWFSGRYKGSVGSCAEQSRQDLEQASRPLLEKIHQGSDYQAAVARRDELKKKLQSLPAGVPALREELEHELALATAKVRKTEKSQLKADADTQDLLKDVDRDEAELRRLIRHRDGEVVRDPRLATALGALTQAKTELLEAQQAVADREGKLAAAQEDLSRKTATQKPPKHRKRHR